ncbi:hypothetical protein D3C75_931390 [compost metagenome]
MAGELLSIGKDTIEHVIDIIHLENMASPAFDFASPIFPVIHEILRSKQMPAMLKTFTIIFSPTMEIKEFELPVFIVRNNIPYPGVLRTIKKFFH